MSINENKILAKYVAKGEKEFAIPFRYLENDDVKVYLERISQDNLLALDRDYTISNNEVIFNEIPTEGSIIIVMRETNITQSSVFMNNSKLPADVLNFCFDKLTMICQELKEQLGRTITLGDSNDVNLDDLIDDIDRLQDYVSNADELSTSATKAAVSAAQALISAINAARYAEEAKSVSGIPEHNNSELAHADIRKLISDLQSAFDLHNQNYAEHITNYNNHVTENMEAHEEFSKEMTDLDTRISNLEMEQGETGGNHYYAFGGNWNCQLGLNWNRNVTEGAISHVGLRNIRKVAHSDMNGIAIANGRLFTTGLAHSGACGPFLQSAQFGFTHLACVNELVGWTDCAAGRQAMFGIYEGKLYSWGNGDSACLGHGDRNWLAVPREVKVSDVTNWKQIECSGNLAIALSDAGEVYTCGWSDYGALGHTANGGVWEFKKVDYLTNVVSVSAGGYYGSRDEAINFCGVLKLGEGGSKELYMWGANYHLQCGTSSGGIIAAPTKVNLSGNPIKISCGGTHAAVLMEDGSVYVAGAAWALQVVNNTTFTPKEVGDEKIVDIACGLDVTYLVTETGKLLGFGVNNNGSLLENPNSNNVVELVASGVEKVYASPMSQSCSFTYNEVADEVE